MRKLFFSFVFGLLAIILSACGPTPVCPGCTSVETAAKDLASVGNTAKQALDIADAPLKAKANEIGTQISNNVGKVANDVAEATDRKVLATGTISGEEVVLTITLVNKQKLPVLFGSKAGEVGQDLKVTWTNVNGDTYLTKFNVKNLETFGFGQNQFESFTGQTIMAGKSLKSGDFTSNPAIQGWNRIK